MKITTILAAVGVAAVGYISYRLYTDGRLPEVGLVVDGEVVAEIPEVEVVHKNPPAAE